MNRLQELYSSKIAPELKKEFGWKNTERIPHLEKIVINVGSGELTTNKAFSEKVQKELGLITGQKPIITQAKKAVAAFKVREGNNIGMKVTLRGTRMYDFLDKLINIIAPRVRDFRGFSEKGFDGNGNYSLGFREQTVFNEIPYESIDRTHGVQITIATSARSNEEGKALLAALGFPFTRQQ